MRRFLLAAVMFGTVSCAQAADMPDYLRGSLPAGPATVNWRGFYLGGQAGYGSSDENLGGSNTNLLAALIVGAIVASTSESIVIPLMRQMKLGEKSQAILSMESSMNDALSIVIALALISSSKANTVSVGAIEQTRLSSLPLQEVTRRSPGAAIASMQNITAMQRGTLVPYQHQKGEVRKTFNQFVRADRGGLVFQPTTGIFQNVAVLDFSSKMASIMIQYNVSPETAGSDEPEAFPLHELGIKIGTREGLVPYALRPLRDKRLALKRLLKTIDKNDPRTRPLRARYKAVINALKWLTVVAYGRLGFANSTFGRINSHEVVSYLSRQVVMQAKGIAEAYGFRVLHLYVDSIFVSHPDATRRDFEMLAEAIEEATHLPIEVQKVYPWFAEFSLLALQGEKACHGFPLPHGRERSTR